MWALAAIESAVALPALSVELEHAANNKQGTDNKKNLVFMINKVYRAKLLTTIAIELGFIETY